MGSKALCILIFMVMMIQNNLLKATLGTTGISGGKAWPARCLACSMYKPHGDPLSCIFLGITHYNVNRVNRSKDLACTSKAGTHKFWPRPYI